MWFRSLLNSPKSRPSVAGVGLSSRRSTSGLQVEALEDRSVPSASLLTDLAADQHGMAPEVPHWIADPVADFLPTYTGPHDAGLDVTAHKVVLVKDRMVFSGRMAGPIAPTQAIGGLYLIGLDRGQGTPRFLGGTPPIGPNVLWDALVIINPSGIGRVNNQVAGVVTLLNPADISIDGNEFSASVPLSLLLPAATRPPEEWTYNLWPRNGIVVGQNQHVSDLAPDDGNSPVQIVPPARVASVGSLTEDPSSGTAAFGHQSQFFVPAFRGLDVAVPRFTPSQAIISPNPVRVAPVFALNYGSESEALPALRGLQSAAARLIESEPPRLSPIFFGLFDGTVDGPLEDGSVT